MSVAEVLPLYAAATFGILAGRLSIGIKRLPLKEALLEVSLEILGLLLATLAIGSLLFFLLVVQAWLLHL